MFLGDDFLLDTPTAVTLYHDYAANAPILDYHCHLPPVEIAENRRFSSITELWLGGDHYKWRAMRANGVPERLVTGDGDDLEKFRAWAATLPAAIGNPLYQWAHLELRRFFGIEELLSPSTADRIYERCNELLATEEFRARSIMKRMGVCGVCTTDDPADDLAYHDALAEEAGFDIPVLPAFRPDKAFKTGDPDAWNGWVDTLAAAADLDIGDYDSLLRALEKRMAFFHERGCRTSDHGLRAPFPLGDDGHASRVFSSARSGNGVSGHDAELFSGNVLRKLGEMYAERNWVMQLHFGAVRNVSTRMLERLGPDTGYDAIGDQPLADNLVALLDALDYESRLPKAIVYTLNPTDNELVASIVGSYQDGSVPGKMQFGSGWWFNDQRDGMEKQMTALANIGLLSRFVGMITDSRSFLSYPRHEYFRRVLCRLLGRWVANGEIPEDYELLGSIVGDISFRNAVRYLELPGVRAGDEA